MVLNQPILDCDDVSFIIEDSILMMVTEIEDKEGIKLERDQIDFAFCDRCEHLGIASGDIYPDEDLPGKFGVHRGYGGGGVHTGLVKSEIHNMKKNRQAKADRILDIFQRYFWSILKDIDANDEELAGIGKEDWEKLTI